MEPASRTEPVTSGTAATVKWRRVVPIVVGALVFLAVAVWTFLATPRYESAALLRIESQANANPLLDELQSVPGIGLTGLGRDELETEIGVLKSRRVADAVVDSLALMVRVTEPAASRAAVLRARVIDPAADRETRLALVRAGDGTYAVEIKKASDSAAVPKAWAPGDTLRVNGVMLRLDPGLRDKGPPRIEFSVLPRFEALKRFDSRLDIRRQEGGSRLVRVAFEDEDRALAAAVVERIVAEYVGYTRQNARTTDARHLGELRRQVDSFASRLAIAEEKLRKFKEQQRLIAPDEQATQQVKRIALLNTQLDNVQVERSALSRMLDLIQKRAAGGSEPGAYRQLATFPSLISNKAIQDFLQSLLDLENKRSELDLRRTADNEEVRQLTGRIAELEIQLNRIGSQYLESLDAQLSVATQAVKALSDDLQAFPGQEMEYVRLVRDRTLLTEGFVLLQKQLKQAELTVAIREEKVRVVDSAKVASADDPNFPKPAVYLLLGAVLAIAVGVAVGAWRELAARPA
jgi:uncharacterized protein involved in exopolysaccharide biosynthesis